MPELSRFGGEATEEIKITEAKPLPYKLKSPTALSRG